MADFLDKVKQGINKGVATVSVKSKEMLDTTRLKTQIDSLGKQKLNLLEELGNIVYTLYKKGTPDEERVRMKCEDVAALDRQITEKEVELRQTRLQAEEALGKPKAVSVCTCGNEIFMGAKFCGKCGKKAEVTEKTGGEVRACAHCGVPLPPDTSFCSDCGNKTEPADQEFSERSATERLCPQCETPVSNTAKFCKKCGARVS